MTNDDTPKALNPRQQAFVTHFIECGNGGLAAARAGYSGDDAALRACASRMLTKAYIKAAIRQAYRDQGVDPAEVLGKLSELAFGDHPAAVQLRALEIMARHLLVTKTEVVPTGTVTLDRRTVAKEKDGSLVVLDDHRKGAGSE